MSIWKRLWQYVEWLGTLFTVLPWGAAAAMTIWGIISHWSAPLIFLGALAAFAFTMVGLVHLRRYQDRQRSLAGSLIIPTPSAGDAAPVEPTATPTSEAKLGRITFLEFRDIAQEHGWSVKGQHDLEILDLLNGLKQAGADGAIQFWGRFDRYGNGSLIHREALTPINKEHWYDFQFEWGSAVNSDLNEHVATWNFGKTDDRTAGRYADIHLDGDAATEWLTQAARDFKGREERRQRAISR